MKAILFTSNMAWNNDRTDNFGNATVKEMDELTEEEMESFYPCSLYYEVGARDDTGYETLKIENISVDGPDGKPIKVFNITTKGPDGVIRNLMHPDPRDINTREHDWATSRYGGADGNAIAFKIDDVKTYNKVNRKEVEKELNSMISGIRNESDDAASEFFPVGDGRILGSTTTEAQFSPLGANAEEMASEFSVERINPTVVKGSEDVRAEEFGAENIEAVDVNLMDGMAMPEGTGSIIGQATPETDFTPFSVSAETCAKCAETFGAEGKKTLIFVDLSGSVNQKVGGNKTLISTWKDHLKSLDDAGTYTVVGLGSRGGDNLLLKEGTASEVGNLKMTSMGGTRPLTKNIIQGYSNMIGGHTDLIYYTDALEYDGYGLAAETFAACGCEDKEADTFFQGAETFSAHVMPLGSGSVTGQATPDTDFTPFGSRAENFAAYAHPVSDRQIYRIRKLGGKVKKDMTRSEASDYIKELMGRESGTWRAEQVVPFGVVGGGNDFGQNLAENFDAEQVVPFGVVGGGNDFGQNLAEDFGAESKGMMNMIFGMGLALAAGIGAKMMIDRMDESEEAPDSEEPSEESEEAPDE